MGEGDAYENKAFDCSMLFILSLTNVPKYLLYLIQFFPWIRFFLLRNMKSRNKRRTQLISTGILQVTNRNTSQMRAFLFRSILIENMC